jgi:hypothetical protein
MGEAEDSQGHTYTRHIPCPFCEGSGNELKLIDIAVPPPGEQTLFYALFFGL